MGTIWLYSTLYIFNIYILSQKSYFWKAPLFVSTDGVASVTIVTTPNLEVDFSAAGTNTLWNGHVYTKYKQYWNSDRPIRTLFCNNIRYIYLIYSRYLFAVSMWSRYSSSSLSLCLQATTRPEFALQEFDPKWNLIDDPYNTWWLWSHSSVYWRWQDLCLHSRESITCHLRDSAPQRLYAMSMIRSVDRKDGNSSIRQQRWSF